MMPPARVQGVKERRREEVGRRGGKGENMGVEGTRKKGRTESTGKGNWYYVYDMLITTLEKENKRNKENEAKKQTN